MITRIPFVSLLGAALFALLAACGNDAQRVEAAKTIEDRFAIQLGDQVVNVQVATFPAEMQRGLMFRKTMPEGEGMLFVFERPQQMGFWMKNTPLPLDIGYLDPLGELKEIYPLYPFDERSVRSLSSQLQIALEMNQGWYARHGVKAGAKLDMKALQEALKARGVDVKKYRLGRR